MQDNIDMKTFTGEIAEPAAEVQPAANTYSQDAEDFPVHREFLEPAPAKVEEGLPVAPRQEENFRALREEVERLKAERDAEKREFQVNLELMKRNLPQAEAPKPKQLMEGREEYDAITVGDFRKEMAERESAYQARIEELEVAKDHPDYAEVIQKYLVPLVNEKPHLIQGIQGASNKSLFAYELAKMAQGLKAQQTPTKTQVEASGAVRAQRIVENAQRPGTLSAAGGQGALSKGDYYASMSDKDFMEIATKHLEGI